MHAGPMEALDIAANDLADLFDISPTALWLEDYSRLHALFERWREEGVTDLRGFLTHQPARLAECSASIRLVQVNQRTLSMFGAASFDELSARLDDILRDDTYDAYLDELEQLWNGCGAFQSKSVNYTLDGRRLDILLKGVILPGYESNWARVLVTVDDITELEEARRRLAASEQYARGIFTQAPVSLWVEDFSTIKHLLDDVREQGIHDFRTFVDVHPEFVDRCMSEIKVCDVNRYTLFLYNAGSKEELLVRLPEVFRDDMRSSFRQQLIDLWEGRLFQQREIVNYALDGKQLHMHLQFSVFPGYEQNWSKVLLALTDITARKKAESYLEYLGKHDVLTGLKNRSFYVDEISRLERKALLPTTIIMIDLNNLKQTNDQLGHTAGDALLRRTGEVLSKAVDKGFQAARIGGDEFVILMPGVDTAGGAEALDSIRKLIDLNNQFYTGPMLSLSMGMATCNKGERLEDALREADLAMYEDKRRYYEAERVDRRRS